MQQHEKVPALRCRECNRLWRPLDPSSTTACPFCGSTEWRTGKRVVG